MVSASTISAIIASALAAVSPAADSDSITVTLHLAPADGLISFVGSREMSLSEMPFPPFSPVFLSWLPPVAPDTAAAEPSGCVARALPESSLLLQWEVSCRVPHIGERVGEEELVYY